MKIFKTILTVLCAIGFMVFGLVQMSAIYSFLHDILGWWMIFSAPLSLLLSYFPLIGSIAGTFAAPKSWGWSIANSFLLFFWYILLYVPILGVEISDRFSQKRSANTKRLIHFISFFFLGAYIILSINAYSLINLHFKNNSTEEMKIQNANKDLPKEVRPGLSATQVSLEGNTLIYTLKFDNIAYQAFEEKKPNLKSIAKGVQEDLCNNKEAKLLEQYKMTYKYLSQDGIYLFKVDIDKSTCRKLSQKTK
jgi:hypothetical protein